jgi:hypothetical protein
MNAYLGLLLKAAAQPFARFVSLDLGLCRLKGGGGKKCIYVAAGLEKTPSKPLNMRKIQLAGPYDIRVDPPTITQISPLKPHNQDGDTGRTARKN